jgi:hypothetical protein
MATSVTKDLIIPIIDARRGYVYGAIYDKEYNVLMDERYIKLEDLIEKIKELEQKLEYKDKNYVGMLNYVKDTVRNGEDYHIKNFDGNIEDTMTNKIKNYNYKNIVDSFISKGIIFDSAIELTNELLKERNINNE